MTDVWDRAAQLPANQRAAFTAWARQTLTRRAALSASDILPTLNPPQQGHRHPLRRALLEAALFQHLLDGGQVVRIQYREARR